MTTQQKTEETLKQVNLPYIDINVYGGRLTITAKGKQTIEQWNSIVSKFAKVTSILDTVVYKQEQTGCVNMPETYKAFRLYARFA